MTGISRIRIEPTQLSLTNFGAVLNKAVEVMPNEGLVSQRNLVLINCAGVSSQLDVRIVRILTPEAKGLDEGHSDAGDSPDEIPQRETWHWFSRSPDDFPDTGGRGAGTARGGVSAGGESCDAQG